MNDTPQTPQQEDESRSLQQTVQAPTTSKAKALKIPLIIAVGVFLCIAVGSVLVLKNDKKDDSANAPQQENAEQTISASTVVDQIKQKWPNDVIDLQKFECAPRTENEWYRTGHSLAIDPKNPDTMYVNVEWLGVFKTVDGGSTWKQITKGIKAYARADDPTKACYSEYPTLKINPMNTKHLMLAASGGGGGNLSLTAPNQQTGGVFQSFDGGETWDFMINETTNLYVNDLAFDPKNDGVAYYSTSSTPASYTEADQTKIFVKDGLVYKTTDYGKSWAELPTGIGELTGATRILLNENNPQEMVVPTFSAKRQSADGTGTGISTGKDITVPQLGILKTTDGGKTWQKLAGSETQPFIGAAHASANFTNMYFTPSMTNGSESYGLVTTDGNTLQKTKYLDLVAYDPNDAKGARLLGFSSISIGPASQNLTLYESRDGGITWNKFGTLPKEIQDPNSRKTRISGISWHPTQKDTIFLNGANGSVWKSEDNAKTWKTLLTADKLLSQQ